MLLDLICAAYNYEWNSKRDGRQRKREREREGEMEMVGRERLLSCVYREVLWKELVRVAYRLIIFKGIFVRNFLEATYKAKRKKLRQVGK